MCIRDRLRDVLDSDFRFSQVAGGDSIYVLYSDESGRDFLMVSLGGDDHDRVDMAVVQCYNCLLYTSGFLLGQFAKIMNSALRRLHFTGGMIQ